MKKPEPNPTIPIARLANYDGPEPDSFPEAKPVTQVHWAQGLAGTLGVQPKSMPAADAPKPRAMPGVWGKAEWLGKAATTPPEPEKPIPVAKPFAPPPQRADDLAPKQMPSAAPKPFVPTMPVAEPRGESSTGSRSSPTLTGSSSLPTPTNPTPAPHGKAVDPLTPKAMPAASAPNIALPHREWDRPASTREPPMGAFSRNAPHMPTPQAEQPDRGGWLDALHENTKAMQELKRAIEDMVGTRKATQPGVRADGGFVPMGSTINKREDPEPSPNAQRGMGAVLRAMQRGA